MRVFFINFCIFCVHFILIKAVAEPFILDSSIIYQTHNRALSMGNAMVGYVPTSELAMKYNPAGIVNTDPQHPNLSVLFGGKVSFDPNVVEQLDKATDFKTASKFVKQVQNKNYLIYGQGWGHLGFQFNFGGSSSFDFDGGGTSPQKMGVSVGQHFIGLVFLSFKQLDQDNLLISDIEGTKNKIIQNFEQTFDQSLSQKQKKRLDQELNQVQNQSENAQEILNLIWKMAVDLQTFLIDVQTIGNAWTLGESWRVGFQVREYNMKVRSLKDYTLLHMVTSDKSIMNFAPEVRDAGQAYELGILYAPKDFTYQLGATYQNIGGVKFSKANVVIPESLNIGGSALLDFGMASLVTAFEVKDIYKTTTYTAYSKKGGRSLEQRSHLGMQLGLFPLFGDYIFLCRCRIKSKCVIPMDFKLIYHGSFYVLVIQNMRVILETNIKRWYIQII